MLLKLRIYFNLLITLLNHLFNKLCFGNRIVYSGNLKVSGGYKLFFDNSTSIIQFGNVELKDDCKFLSYNNAKIVIGNGVFLNNNCSINALFGITIKDNTIIGESVKIYDHNHNYKNKSINIKDQGFNGNEVVIEENCWIGSNVVILKGVNIGKNSIIGAGCVIFKSIPENSIIVSSNSMSIKTY